MRVKSAIPVTTSWISTGKKICQVTGLEPEVSGFLQAQTNRGRSPALGTVRRPTARTEHGYQRFTRLAAHRTIGLDGPDVRGRSIALVAFSAFLTRGSLRSLRSLGPACPCTPATPCMPCAPCGPAGPCGPGSPLGPGSLPQAASESERPRSSSEKSSLIAL
jgi:hypothetical protein